jgi:hypothetical protein
MEYRGVEYQVVQTISNGWRWSVRREPKDDKVGTTDNRMGAVERARKFIDELIKSRERTKAKE